MSIHRVQRLYADHHLVQACACFAVTVTPSTRGEPSKKLNLTYLQPAAVFTPLRLGSVMKRCFGSTEKPLHSTSIVTTAGLLLRSADS